MDLGVEFGVACVLGVALGDAVLVGVALGVLCGAVALEDEPEPPPELLLELLPELPPELRRTPVVVFWLFVFEVGTPFACSAFELIVEAFFIADTTPGSTVGAGLILIMSLVACLIVSKVYLKPETIWNQIFFENSENVSSWNSGATGAGSAITSTTSRFSTVCPNTKFVPKDNANESVSTSTATFWARRVYFIM